MQHAALFRRAFGFPVAIMALAFFAMLCTVRAHADQYADVNQMHQQGNSAGALTKAEAYIAANPRDPQMRFLRGVILTEQGKSAEALQAFTELTQDFPELPEPYNNLAGLYAAQNQLDKARAALETALKLNPNYATAHENLGDVYVRLAAKSFTRTQQLEAGNTTVAPKLTRLRELISPSPAKDTQAPSPRKSDFSTKNSSY